MGGSSPRSDHRHSACVVAIPGPPGEKPFPHTPVSAKIRPGVGLTHVAHASNELLPGTRRMPIPEERRYMDDKLSGIIVELRRQFKLLYGERLVQMVLFGSQARGDAEPESDIDVLVVLRGKVSPCEEIDRTIQDVADLSL